MSRYFDAPLIDQLPTRGTGKTCIYQEPLVTLRKQLKTISGAYEPVSIGLGFRV